MTPTPITKGFKKTSFLRNERAIAQGSPSQASMPSVIKTITFLQFEQGGKSSFDNSKDRAIGVVPFGTTPFITCLMSSMLLLLKGTSKCVSSQSCALELMLDLLP